jgi:hypothetical protein
MSYSYPTPCELGMKIPPHLRENCFNSGFEHALRGGQLTEVKHLRLSFRMGFRAAKLYLWHVRREHGIIDFPLRAKVRIRAR